MHVVVLTPWKSTGVKGLSLSADCPNHLMLFRRYVSRHAAGKARAVLEGVGLETSTIDACFSAHSSNDEEIVQAGLVKWRDGQGNKQPPTWEVLISAMEYAEVAQQHMKELKEKLALSVKEPKVCMCTISCVTSKCRRFGACVLHIYVCGSVLYLLSCQLTPPTGPPSLCMSCSLFIPQESHELVPRQRRCTMV